MATSVAATIAGFAALIRHLVAGDGPLAYVGLALLTYGGSVVPLTAIVGHLDSPAAGIHLEALRLAAVVAVVLLLAGGLAAADVDTSAALQRLALVTVVGIAGLTVVFETSLRLGSPMNDVTTRAIAPLWFAVACGYLAAGLRRRRTALWRIGGGLLVITIAQFVRVLEPSPGDVVAMSLAAIRQVGAAVIVLGIVPDLVSALSARRRSEESIRDWWTTAETDRQAILDEVAERRHEIANALTGIAGANFALDPSCQYANSQDSALLRRAVQQEVERIQHLVGEQRDQAPDHTFFVRDVVRPLVAARRALGERLTLNVDPRIEAFGSPEALSQILVNLFINCARHAVGSHVEVTAMHEKGRVVVSVVDGGPVSRVAGATGNGLGLAVSARVAEQHGARLRLLPRSPGEAGFGIAVDLPAPPRPAMGDPMVPTARQDAGSRSTARREPQAS